MLTVGKEVTFSSVHSLPANDDVARDLGNVELGGIDLTMELLRNGWAKIKDFKRDPTEDDQKRKEAENEAKSAGKGLWNPHGPKVRNGPIRVVFICSSNVNRPGLSIILCL